jgi:hypothetical protein
VSTIAATVVLTSAASAIIDFLFKSQAAASLGTGANLLRFFAAFYGVLQVLTFIAQTVTGVLTHRLGFRRTIATLPAGVGLAGLVALLLQGWPPVVALRGIESVLRSSFFRNAYELLFVPMDPGERQRVKTSLDVTCDRAGEAAGAAVVQAVLVAGVTVARGWLLTVVFLLAALTLWLGRRLDQLYLGVIENQLIKYRSAPPAMSMVSEAGWTIVQLPKEMGTDSGVDTPVAAKPLPTPHLDSSMELLVALRSPDPARVSAALASTSNLSRIHVAQIVDLLAWDEVMPSVRKALEPVAPAHLGLLVDALVEPSTDFAIRRRVPRILGTVASARSLDGLVRGLDDPRFEVRYHCSRAINRILTSNPELSVNRAHMIAIVERELAVTPQVWRGYRLLDLPEVDEPSEIEAPPEAERTRHLEHIFALLSMIVAREPLDAAVDGIRSPNAGVRGLAIEYLDQVLPAHVLGRLRALIASTPSSGDAPSQSDVRPGATRSSERR